MKHLLSLLPDKFYLVLLLIFITLAGVSVYYLNYGLENSIDWIVTTNTEIQKINVDTFTNGLFAFNIPGDNHLIWKTFSASPMNIDLNILYLMLICLGLGLALIHTAVSYFSRIPFIAANLVLLFLINMIHLEQAMLFGSDSRTIVFVLIGVLLAVGYGFQSFFESVSAFLRFLSFSGVYLIVGLITHYTSSLIDPFLVIAPYAFNSAILLTVIFIAATSQEVIYLILRLSTASIAGIKANNGKHFLIVSIIYLANLLFLYLKNGGHIRVELTIINEFTILFFSSIVAIYTLKEKKALFGDEQFLSWGYYLFVGLGIASFGLIASQAALANDPVLDAIKDVISYIHLAFGVMFFFYIVLNFINPLLQSLPVYKIAYKEVNFPYITSLLAGTAGVAGFFFLAGKVPFLEVKSGYFNLHGDIQLVQRNIGLSERYYEQGQLYAGNNHKSSYQLATISKITGNRSNFEFYMKKSFIKNPSEQGYIRLADYHKEENNYFQSMFVLKDGLEKFPRSSSLRNNLAVMYTNANILDSALIYLDKSIFDEKWQGMSESNSWYVLTKSNLLFDQDTLQQLISVAEDFSVQSNYMAYANAKNIKLDLPKYQLFQDTILENATLSILNNLAVNNSNLNFDLKQHIIDKNNVLSNSNYSTILDYDLAIASYFDGDLNLTLRTIDKLQGATPSKKGDYLNIAGLVTYKEAAYLTSRDFFEQSLGTGNIDAELNYGLALSESGKMDEAIEYWKKLEAFAVDSSTYDLAFNLRRNLSLSQEEVLLNQNDVVKFQYLKFNGINLGFDEFIKILESITENNLRIGVINDQIIDLLNLGKVDNAKLYLDYADTNQLPVQGALIRDFVLLDNLGSKITLEGIEEPVFKLLDSELDSTALVQVYDLASANPFDEALLLYTSQLLKSKGKTQTAYDILQSATEINSYSVPLLKEFALTAVEANFANYGEAALLRLYDLVDSEEYYSFTAKFDLLKQEVASRDIWDF